MRGPFNFRSWGANPSRWIPAARRGDLHRVRDLVAAHLNTHHVGLVITRFLIAPKRGSNPEVQAAPDRCLAPSFIPKWLAISWGEEVSTALERPPTLKRERDGQLGER